MFINRRRFVVSTSGSALAACAGFLACAAGCGGRKDDKDSADDLPDLPLFTGKLRASTKAQEDHLQSVAISPDGKLAVTGGSYLRFWSTTDAKEVRKAPINAAAPERASVSGLVYLPDGKQVAGLVHDRDHPAAQARFWDAATCKEVPRKLPRGWWSTMALSADGHQLALAENDKRDNPVIQVWDLKQSRTLHEFRPSRQLVGIPGTLAFSPDGERLAVTFSAGEAASSKGKSIGSPEPLLWVWDLTTGKTLFKEWKTFGSLISVAFSPNGKLLAACGHADEGKKGEIRIWNVASRKRVHKFPADERMLICIAFHPKGGTLASGGNESDIKLWDVKAGKLITRLEGHTGQVKWLSFSGDGTTLASIGYDKKLLIWELTQK